MAKAKAKNTERDRRTTGPAAPAAPQLITDVIETNYMPDTMSVIISRAIPEIDGFFGASSIERFAAERGIKAQAAAFKAITK